ncbi:MAG: hypothetical protein KDC87_01410 [Planctomycetes bacterium]|nr:hypothetical protein [Planctomycetota bacterium]MCB9869602.1 hypothetical protein [Planctomycetota bacterium]MCB9889845.1 hypothetical protein [Planctomycetota bacterium]
MTGQPPRPLSRPRVLLGLLLAAGGIALTPPQDKTAPFPRHGAFAGKAACLDCHDEQGKQLGAGHHAQVAQLTALQGCESCHGPGKAHAENSENDPRLITHPRKLDADAQQKLCGRCHADRIRNHGGDLAGLLASGKVCTSCHTVHTAKKDPPHAGLRFAARNDTLAKAKPVGAQKCLGCHPLRNELLRHSHHHRLAAAADQKGCETCHGNGSLHVETGGLARLITRPDTARSGMSTCLECHGEVDPIAFHWKNDPHPPLLGRNLTCTTCHTVHEAITSPARRVLPGGAKPTNATCAKCHEPAFGVLHGTIHQSLAARDIPLEKGCGACHAGAAEHARQGGRKALVDSLHGSNAKHQNQTCGQCHAKDHALRGVRSGAHHRNEVSCLTCHSPAAPRGRVREDASQKCTQCHTKVATEFRLPNHHPVPEHRMGCVDCHEPHSARTKIRDRSLREDTCVKCHKQYRGPFVYAHQASRIDGCVVCHSPHGSTNRRMLKQHNAQQNCLQCHANFPSFHDQTSGAVFTNCLNCHTQVHGSNFSRYLFR